MIAISLPLFLFNIDMNKLSTCIFCFIVVIIGLYFIGTCKYNNTIKDNIINEKDSNVCEINDTIDSLIIE